MSSHFLTDPEKIVIRKEGNEVFLLSSFSEECNTATRFIEGNENSYFLKKDQPLESIYEGKFFAECWDNQAPAIMGKHGILGANHGSPFAFHVHLLRHWLFEKDIGKVLTDDAGEKFVLVSVDSLCDLTLHSDIPENGKTFCTEITGALHIDGRIIQPETIHNVLLGPALGKQIAPHRRYHSVRLWIDGKEIPDGETVECAAAELRWDVDLVLPEALLSYIKANPGKYVSPTDPRLEGAVHSDTKIIFRPHCCRTVETEVTFLKDLHEDLRYGLLQFYGAIGYEEHEKLLPGVKEITLPSGAKINLANTYHFPDPFSASYCYTKKDCTDPTRLPCRYLDFFGNNGKRELGVVLGYSMTRGITARGREAERGDTVYHLYSSTKSYPHAFEKKGAVKGEKFHLFAYQQYFQPDPSGISCYHHQEEDDYFLYADFPRAAENFTVKLPRSLAGRKIEIVEKDPGISCKEDPCCLPEDGRLCLQAEGKGGIVLKF